MNFLSNHQSALESLMCPYGCTVLHIGHLLKNNFKKYRKVYHYTSWEYGLKNYKGHQ